MNMRNWHIGVGLLLLAVLTLTATYQLTQLLGKEAELSVEIGGTYEEMRKRSSASFSPLIRGHLWLGIPAEDARLRFIDPQYGFVTPAARYFTVGFDDNVIDGIHMSPQIEPLLLDDALKVVLDLQDQWKEKGWMPVGLRRNPTIADTPEWRSFLRQGIRHGRCFWQAGDKYHAMLSLGRFRDSRNPTEERYLISLSLAKLWIPIAEMEDRWEEENLRLLEHPETHPAPESTGDSGV